MKTLVIFTFIILVYNPFNSDGFNVHRLLRKCCPNVTRTCIPEVAVTNVVKSQCSVDAVIVTTRKNITLCIDANWDWANNLLERSKNPAFGTTKMPASNIPCKKNPKKANKPAASNRLSKV